MSVLLLEMAIRSQVFYKVFLSSDSFLHGVGKRGGTPAFYTLSLVP